jgi:two-component system sensor histidine kinase/response regulator
VTSAEVPAAARSRILIVDDMPENLQILLAILKERYAVLVARSGEKAIEIANNAQLRPDMILLDILMPGMDGYAVCRHLKSGAGTRDIPVVFVSALDHEEDEAFGLGLGALDYIRKPFSAPIVLMRIRNHLELQRVRRQLEEQNRALVEAARLREHVDRLARHDLKNPLSFIIGIPQLIAEDDNLTPLQRENLYRIESAGYRMLEMIDRSLDLYKMEMGQYRFQPEHFAFGPFFNKVIEEQADLARAKSVRVRVAYGEDHDSVSAQLFGEKFLCYSLFSNLLKNAIEASPFDADVTVTYGQCRDGHGGSRVVLHNRGAVPAEIRDRFFDKYVTSGKSFGTGLGTYSAFLIVQTHRGTIDMGTDEDTGTTITVCLPVSPDSDNTDGCGIHHNGGAGPDIHTARGGSASGGHAAGTAPVSLP